METDFDVRKMAESIKKRLPGSTGCGHQAASTIYQVPRLLRQVDENCHEPVPISIYEPMLISIGPNYRGKEWLQPMEEQKLHHLQKILSRNKKVKLEDYIEKIMKLEEPARKRYRQSLSHITRDEFVQMMLLDGCFLVEIFLQKDVEKDAPEEMWLRDFKSHDMLLVENQLPYFVLRRIFKLVVEDRMKVVSMAELALDCFDVMPLNETASMKKSYHHLVDLFHHHCSPTLSETNKSNDGRGMDSSVNNSGGGCSGGGDSSIKTKLVRLVDSVNSFLSRQPEMHLPLQAPRARVIDSKGKKAIVYLPLEELYQQQQPLSSPSAEELEDPLSEEVEDPLSIPSAEELEEAGIVFKRKKKRGSFLSIEFHKNTGEMEIPYFYFSDGLDSVFHNFVAFELCRYPNVHCRDPNAHAFFLGYLIFIDCIINTGKDVKILRRSKVLEHGLGSDEELARVFNRMTRGVYFDAKKTPLADTYKCINDYCGRRRNVWRATLVHNHFNSPWAIISFIAAVVLLSLTVVQTFFTIFPRN